MRVAVGAGQRYHHDITPADVLTEEVEVLAGEAGKRHLHRAQVAQELLDDRIDLGGGTGA